MIDLPEGAEPEMYEVTPTAPPYVLCRELSLTAPDNCSIVLSAHTPLDDNELKCPGGKVMKQVAVSMFLKVGARKQNMSGFTTLIHSYVLTFTS